MKTILCILLLSLFFWGCATTAGYEKVLQTWKGHDVNELIQKWGPPSDVFKLPNNSVMYTWLYDGGAVAIPIGKIAYAMRRYCKTTFTVDEQGIIQTWRWEGNACRH